MADTLLHHLSTAETFLLSSTRFWSSLSAVAIAGALSSLYSTQQTFNHSTKYIFSFIIASHLIIFFSNPQTLKNKLAPFYLGSAFKWALRITAVRIGYVLHYVPEQSVMGLMFVICVWVDAIAIARIVRASVDLWVVNSVFMAVVSRSGELYGFSGRYWLVMLCCFPLIFVQVRLEGYKSTGEVEEKEG